MTPATLTAAIALLRIQAAYAFVVLVVMIAGFYRADIVALSLGSILALVLLVPCTVYAAVVVTLSARIGRRHGRGAWRMTCAFEAGQVIACVIGVLGNGWGRSWVEIGVLVLPAMTFALLQTREARAFVFAGNSNAVPA